MPQASDNREVDAINDAFHDKICVLFGVLVGSLVETADVPGGEQKSVDRFAKAFGFARRARELALEVAKVPREIQSVAKSEVDQA
jgi:hypothetical protein